jgi:hypothetical protein
MEGLNIISLDLGSVVPLIKQASEPWYDDKGLWVHLDLDYSGGVQILISTKLNLMKLKAKHENAMNQTSNNNTVPNMRFSFKNDNEPVVSSNIDSPPSKLSNELLENSLHENNVLNER